MKTLLNLFMLTFILAIPTYSLAEDGHEEGGHDEAGAEEGEHGNEIELSAIQISTAGIVVEPLALSTIKAEVSAPGEVKLNDYLTRKVTPRITAQVMQRHVRLGDHVIIGQPLVTLSSVEMSEAQGTLQVAEREWQRVRELGRATVSDRRYIEARVASEQARARVVAYGMTEGQVDELLAGKKGMKADGAFQLLAVQPGTVIRDAFIEGEFVEPGRVLIEISDETQIWVEASLTSSEAQGIAVGAAARVRVGDNWLAGKVIQSHHMLDEITRTRAIRIELPNPEERLHPGLFVDTRIEGSALKDSLAVPEHALLRSSDGDWVVFVEDEPNTFKPVEVEWQRTVDGMALIEGIDAGTRVVTSGAFFVQSELAKSGFEVHNH